MSDQDTPQEQKPSPRGAQEPNQARGGTTVGGNTAESWSDLSYKHKDLDIKRWQLRVQIASLIVAGLGFFFLWSSVNNNTRSLGATVQNNMLTHLTDLNKLLREKPWIYPYFYANQAPDPKDTRYQELLFAAMSYADVLDIVSIQSTQYKEQFESPEAWDKWTCDMLEHSPILQQYLQEHRTWYGKGLIRKLDQVNSKKECK